MNKFFNYNVNLSGRDELIAELKTGYFITFLPVSGITVLSV